MERLMLVTAVIFMTVLVASSATSQSNSDGPFTVTINLADNYTTGDDIECRITITNVHDKPLYLLKYNTPLEEDQRSHQFIITSEDHQTIKYDGIFVKRMQPTVEDFVHVQPGESLKALVDLSMVYPLLKEGVYVVSYDANVAFTDVENFTNPESFKRQHVVSPPVKFQLLKHYTNPPKIPAGELQRQFEALSLAKINDTQKLDKLGATGPISPRFAGSGSSSDESTATNAYALAYQKINVNVNSYLSSYYTWFGSTSYISNVQYNYNLIYSYMGRQSYTIYFYGSKCKKNDFAYTYQGTTTIYLCSGYFGASYSYGHDTKYGTLIHELSHAVAYTEDYEYGEYALKQLAAEDPYKAIRNADSYEYFIEEISGL